MDLMQTSTPSQSALSGHFEVFAYPGAADSGPPAGWECWQQPADALKTESSAEAGDPGRAAAVALLQADFDKRLAEEVHKAFEAGRERGRGEGREAEYVAQAGALAAAAQERTRRAAELLDGFTRERDRLFHAVEQEVVDLALAIAARILRREAQMDPLLLTGAVRVALGQLSGSTQVTLKVPPAELDLWREAMALVPNLALKPAVVAGEGMRLGDCQVETALGSVDLGIRTQLGEIERGFFDRAGGCKTHLEADVPAQEGTAA
jgi:flagellar assembly protein FliH